ncbi:MFS transporter [Kribbella sp. NBC_01245]|uniref:MFS transporter n=1 Tax=Kribbella sp. NBC_01245 TaxID=2903578 RepID=UPI002E2D0905|nr:MFS transporter [Kribbella sp. NBC_01245]
MSTLGKRLLPLQVATFLQGFALWVPVEKLFMTEIGFDAASVGLMAAAYAALVPVVEIPSGVLADRWSRRGVLMIAGIALAVSTVGGGLSDGVPAYIAAAMALGVYFAMFSGTLDAVVYDTVLEETGDSASFERRIGQVRLIESIALVTSALAGGWIASLAGTRSTYFLSIPFVIASVLALTRFREPTLHRGSERTDLRRHFALTYRAILHRGRLLPLVAASIATTVILQSVFEFGPLWLIDLASPAVLYGPFWAVLVATLGLGGLLAGRIDLGRRTTIAGVVAVMIGTGLVLTTAVPFLGVTAAFVTLALLVVVAGIHLTRVMHDAVDSTVRAGVASGVGAVSWLAFVPFALAMGSTSKADGVHTAGWLLTGVIVLAGLALAWGSLRKISAEPERVLLESR